MRTLHSLMRLLPWVLGSAVASVVGLWCVRQVAPMELLRASNDVVGNYLQTLGSIYAVLLAFVVFVVWQQFNDARTQIEREAAEIVDLFRMSRGLPGDVQSNLRSRLVAYVDGVLLLEWPAMARRCEKGEIARVSELLDHVFNELTRFEPCSDWHKTLHAEALGSLNELSNARTARLSASKLRIPLALRVLLYAGAVIVVSSMWIFAVDSLALHAFITGALAGAISHVLYVIEDLDDCFSGDWQIPRNAFEQARELMNEHALHRDVPARVRGTAA